MNVAYVETPDAEPLGVRRQFGAALCRRLLDQHFGAGVARVETAESGQPIVIGAGEPAFVSLTHTERVVVAAFATARVGVDAEHIDRTATHPALHSRVCSSSELRWLDQLPQDRRDEGFLRLWTRKEAYGKAIGVGIGFDLRSTNFIPDDERLGGVPGEWHARAVDITADVVAVVVVEGSVSPAGRVTVSKVDHRELARLG